MFACMFQLPLIEFGYIYIYIYIYMCVCVCVRVCVFSEMQSFQESINTHSVAFIFNSSIQAHILCTIATTEYFLPVLCSHIGRVGA